MGLLGASFRKKDISFPCPLSPMGKEKKEVNGQCASAESEGFAKAMPPSGATGVGFVTLSRCGSMETA